MKAFVGEDASYSTQYPNACFATLRESTNSYHLSTIQKLGLFSHHTFSPAGLCIHSEQACCILALHTFSFTTASVLPTLEHVPTEHATQNAHGPLLLMHL